MEQGNGQIVHYFDHKAIIFDPFKHTKTEPEAHFQWHFLLILLTIFSHQAIVQNGLESLRYVLNKMLGNS